MRYGVLLSMGLQAQYITLPDTVLANYLATTYPSVCNASKQLDTSAAKLITGSFNGGRKGFTNMEGIQYFHGLQTLLLINNSIRYFPPIPKLINLTELDLDSNQLTELPDLRPNYNLYRLRVSFNKLTYLPPMNGMFKLHQFFCRENKLTALPDMTGMTGLYHFIGSDNLLTSIPDFSSLTNLNRMLLINNKFTEIDLRQIPHVKEISLRNNKLVKFPNIAGMTQITQLMLSGNLLDSLPDLSSYVNLSLLELHENKFSFEDLAPLRSHPNFALFKLSPQKNLGTPDTLYSKVGKSVTLSFDFDKQVTTNTWIWYRNGIPVDTTAIPAFTKTNLSLSDGGMYEAKVKSSLSGFSSIVLNSVPIAVEVSNCMDASLLSWEQSSSPCQAPLEIRLDTASLLNAEFPLQYVLENSNNGNRYTFQRASWTVPSPGIYHLSISDRAGCEVFLSKKIEVKKNEACEPVLYPDLAGTESSYFVPETGEAKIYDINGNVVCSFTTPGYWNGRSTSGGRLPAGLYVLVINEKVKIQLNLMY